MNIVHQEILSAWSNRYKSKTTPSGWTSGNAVCCHHFGHKIDDRGRGGIKCEGDSLTYHCFNCGYTANYKTGRRINYKMRKLMEWIGISDDDIRRLSLFALSNIDSNQEIKREEQVELPQFEPREPCPGRSILSWLNDGHINEQDYNSLEQAINYLDRRGLASKLDLFHWSDSVALRNRVLVPFTLYDKPMGYSGRLFVDGKKSIKYFSNYPSNMIWGYDRQHDSRKFCIVVEGLLDAVSIDGIAVCGNECSETQATMIDSLNREVIVVPDRDKSGTSLIKDALNYNWNVAFPDWGDGIKDVSDAVAVYGQTFTMRSILNSVEHSNLKINLMMKKWI